MFYLGIFDNTIENHRISRVKDFISKNENVIKRYGNNFTLKSLDEGVQGSVTFHSLAHKECRYLLMTKNDGKVFILHAKWTHDWNGRNLTITDIFDVTAKEFHPIWTIKK